MSDMTVVDLRGNMLTPHEGRRLVDTVVATGVERKHLRWAMGRMARRGLQRYLDTVGSLDYLTRDAVFGGGEESGMFLGIPYVVVPGVTDGVIHLQLVGLTELVGMLSGVGVEAPAEGG